MFGALPSGTYCNETGRPYCLSRYCRFIASLSRSLCGDIEDSWPVLTIAVSNSSRLTTPVLSHLGIGRWSEYEYANRSFDPNCFGSIDALLRGVTNQIAWSLGQ